MKCSGSSSSQCTKNWKHPKPTVTTSVATNCNLVRTLRSCFYYLHAKFKNHALPTCSCSTHTKAWKWGSITSLKHSWILCSSTLRVRHASWNEDTLSQWYCLISELWCVPRRWELVGHNSWWWSMVWYRWYSYNLNKEVKYLFRKQS